MAVLVVVAAPVSALAITVGPDARRTHVVAVAVAAPVIVAALVNRNDAVILVDPAWTVGQPVRRRSPETRS